MEAGEAVQKHMAVSIQAGGKVLPSSPSIGPVVGFALQDAVKGESLPVQVDGIIYGYSYKNLILQPGIWYFQGTDGEIITDKTSGGHTVGFAVTENIFRIFMLNDGASADKPDLTTLPIISGAEKLEDVADPYQDSDVVDGSGDSLSDAVEQGWADWGSIGYDGTLSDMYLDNLIDGPDEGGATDDGLGIVDGGSLDSIFSDDGSYSGDEDSMGGNLDLSSLLEAMSGGGTSDGGSVTDLPSGGNDDDVPSDDGGSLSNLPDGFNDDEGDSSGSLSDLPDGFNDDEGDDSGSLSNLYNTGESDPDADSGNAGSGGGSLSDLFGG